MQDALTPMMQQYQRLRKSIPSDALLLFRLGDFYELFFEDAKEASALLNVALTKRNEVPMCGVPHHAAQSYIAKLIKAGRRVAICDQTSEPQPGKIVSRDITQIISAGTISELDLLELKRANYLGAVYIDNNSFGFAYADLTTGESRNDRDTSLLAVLDRTVTPIGARKLRAWILQPLRDLRQLECRQQMIADVLQEPDLLAAIRSELKSIRDIERAVGRLSQASGNARDLVALKTSLQQIPKLKAELQKLIQRTEFGRGRPVRAGLMVGAPIESVEAAVSAAIPSAEQAARLPLQQRLQNEIQEMPALAEKLGKALVDDPPLALKEGGIFRGGYDVDLDELRQASRDGKDWISQLQEREIAATGIKSLKVRFNSVFGYFIEVTKSNLANVPAHYTRKQTTVGGERFITPELKEMEGKILGADERAHQLEYHLFQKLRDETLRELAPIQQTAVAIAIVDVLCALAETARLFNYCRPGLNESLRLVIKDGRHPVLDQNLVEEKFVPNDTSLDGESMRLAIVTGPNMAGKSTYIRQVALIVLMAQTGSFVPAASAEIGLVDRIFTRVGANDDLARGQSTFMVEMNETSNIVNNATERSLVILDEIGRGTSTFDGLSIAWSVTEFLHDKIKARTLFATHYHELTKLAVERKGVVNFNVAVREWNEQIIFLRKIIPGGADKSYGIQVARLAGLPKEILDRAKEILAHLENPNGVAEQQPKTRKKRSTSAPTEAEKPQLDLL